MPWYPKKYRNMVAIRERFEPNKYYHVRAKIMAECYLEGWNPKQIVSYFNLNVDQFYKFCEVKKLKLMVLEKRLND